MSANGGTQANVPPEGLTQQGEAPQLGKTFVDLFAGCGGLSLGLMLAGWRGLIAVEKDPLAFETLKHNLISRDSSQGVRYDWLNWFPKEPCTVQRFLSGYRTRIKELAGKVDLIAGGPPCQGFSFAGRRDRRDRRNALIEKYYVEVVKLIKPRLVLLENVKGISIEFGKKERAARRRQKKRVGRPPKSFAQRIKGDLEGAGYTVFARSVRAADFGVAQLRPRYILIAIRRDDAGCARVPLDPFAMLQEARVRFLSSKGLSMTRPVSVRQAISDLRVSDKRLTVCEDSRGFKQIQYRGPMTEYQRLLHGSMNGRAPNSLRLANHRSKTRTRFEKMLKVCRRGVVLSRKEKRRIGMNKHTIVVLDPNKASHTLTTLPDDLLHYSEPRILTVRECARLQSFPDWFEFKAKYTTGGPDRKREAPRYTQVGNAVPPFLAEVAGEALKELLARVSVSSRRRRRREDVATGGRRQ